MSENNYQFYSNLPANNISIGELFNQKKLFYQVPEDWHIIITDIRGSTKAVLNGLQQHVNLVATGSIVTVLNIAFKHHINIPFFFGGDGATFIVPPMIIEEITESLAVYKNNMYATFQLDLRTGSVPVHRVYSYGNQLNIAKFNTSAKFAIPVILGNGLSYAERDIKGMDYYLLDYQGVHMRKPDLTGMQCRWDAIAPPENKEEIVSLLIIAHHEPKQSELFTYILAKLDQIYGIPSIRQPISISKLKRNTTFYKLGLEMRAKSGTTKALHLVRDWVLAFSDYIFLRSGDGKNYLKSLVEMSDTLVLDGRINTVISGTNTQRKALQAILDKLESEQEIIYGLHVSKASIMSCYVRDRQDDHIHFVDGADGGYTQAARMLKEKLKKPPFNIFITHAI